MAARVNDAEVKEIIDTSLTTTAFITAANLTVNNYLGGTDLDDDTLKEIERWLSAHFVAIRDPKIRSEGMGKATQVYEVGLMGKSLEFTSWGQQVLLLDSSGKLRNAGKRASKIEAINFTDYTLP